ncbi:MAG TPA: hypothetical protein VGF76_07385 [Polyangiaceae bacterium]
MPIFVGFFWGAGQMLALEGQGGAAEVGAAGESGSAGESGAPNAPAIPMLTETLLTIKMSLQLTPATASLPAVSVLEITARDGVEPVVTDLWLYTLAGEQRTPLTDFTSTAARKTPALMLPATINGKPSGLVPASDGTFNGVMTNATRGVLTQGAFVSTVTGTVNITLPAIPTKPILVVAGVEDQRDSGAAVINVDGSPGTVPAGVGLPETHVKRSFERDIKPLLTPACMTACHNPRGPEGAAMYKLDTREDLVNDNFALSQGSADCQAKFPAGGEALAACIQAINKAQFLVEPGAPAVSDLLRRARPDELASTSPTGLAWYGGGTPKTRYSAKYGDRRMPSTTISLVTTDWTDVPTLFDGEPAQYQILYDWVAQGALP